MSAKFDDDDPEVIRAKAEAKAKLLEARAKLRPVAQVLYTFLDGVGDILHDLGCLLIILIIIIGLFAPQLFKLILGN